MSSTQAQKICSGTKAMRKNRSRKHCAICTYSAQYFCWILKVYFQEKDLTYCAQYGIIYMELRKGNSKIGNRNITERRNSHETLHKHERSGRNHRSTWIVHLKVPRQRNRRNRWTAYRADSHLPWKTRSSLRFKTSHREGFALPLGVTSLPQNYEFVKAFCRERI